MKKLAAALFSLFCFICQAQTGRSIPVGSSISMAADKLKDISGKEVSIREAMEANGVLVMFSCNTCPYVLKNQARTKAVAAFAKQNHIGIILLNSNEGGRGEGDSYGDMQVYAKQQGYDFYYALDSGSRIANAFGATRTPEVYLFDRKGILQYKGAIDDNPADASRVKRPHATEAIREMVSGKAISVRESRSLGCGIKRV